ncbi:hypothetical protein HU200_045418 [Digitaria exilis]|uniref:Receptor kinase-like protein Xa21 n=1 Tax=Digitaria exilis TaxID=1010633 RepID=A0A835B3A7_9POAL|nr:hypothetical protein HU200_045418 [Digitaria exilis]
MLLLLYSLVSTVLAFTAAGASSRHDAAALLAFKAAAIGTGATALASWNGSAAGLCTTWEGVTCGRHGRVVSLRLPSLGLSGTLSPAIGDLPRLQTLDLCSNWLHGGIPASLGRLRHLQTLDLRVNTFSGELPGNLTACKNLKSLLLSSNRLTGRVPAELADALPLRLQVLYLNNNSFTGPLPASLSNLTSLRRLILGINGFEGPIPHDLGRDNWLRGSIPADIHVKLPRLQYLALFENLFSGTIPSSISNLTDLQGLELSKNGFSGFVPRDLGRLKSLWNLQLDGNSLQAGRTEGWEFMDSLTNCRWLKVLALSYNNFTGDLPASVASLSTTLEELYLVDLGISGSIPSDIGNLIGLKVLCLVNTSISGVIPESIGKLENLTKLYLDNNRLLGFIPSSVGNLTKLITLSAPNNNFGGSIPRHIGKLNSLTSLDFSWNYLNGSIPKEVFELQSLSSTLDLSHNSLSGPLPFEVGSLANLNTLSLSGNQLSGQVPTTIKNCIVLETLLLDSNSFQGSIPQPLGDIKGLRTVNLTMNKFSGAIPDSLGSIHNLQHLYIAHNNLSSPIPTDLQNLTSLSDLNLSFNDLQGEVPKEGIFSNMSYPSIAGNKHLCGGIPRLRLDPCSHPAPSKSNAVRLKYIRICLATTGALVFVASLVTTIMLLHRRPKQRQKSQPRALLTEEQYERVSYQELFDGTKGFSEQNLLGKGSYGTVYKCTSIDEGTVTAVKVFNLELSGSTRSFLAECEALRRVRHRCLIRIITCCSSIDRQGQEFKALVFEFMPHGSLNCWLHPTSDMPPVTNTTLSLTQRLDIAVDIVDALDYLHNHCQPPIVHCDLKPSNILLAEDMSARVGDLGISRILSENASKTHLNSTNSTMGIRGSIGYVAPEYGEGCAVSTLGDVYSLGILLLEMFTGRSPTDDVFRDSLDLHRFCEDAFPDRILEIADPTLWAHSDTNDGITRSRVQECLISVIGLGLSCSKHQPKERKPVADVAVEMHAIRDEAYLMFAGSLAIDMEGKAEAKTAQ